MPSLPYTALTTLRDGLRSIDAIAAYRIDDAMIGRGAASDASRLAHEGRNVWDARRETASGTLLWSRRGVVAGRRLDERFWRAALGSDADIVDKPIVINDSPCTVVGVAPAGFTGVELPSRWIAPRN